MTTMQEALDQAVAINGLFRKLVDVESTSAYDGDRISYQLVSSFTFQTANTQPGQMTFNVPEDADFFGQRMNLFLESRRIDLADDTKSDLVFRPARWSPTIFTRYDLAFCASAAFGLRDSMRGSTQTAPMSIISAFSSEIFQTNTWAGALEFHVPYYLKRGSTLTVDITPTFSTLNGAAVVREFLVRGVVDGWKPVV